MYIKERKFYRTRNGNKAIVYAIHRNQSGGVHGAIFDGGKWVITHWELNGRYFDPVDDHPCSLVSPWEASPIVDFNYFPAHIVAVAMDEDGDWHGFSDIPAANIRDKAWYSSVSGLHDLYCTFDLYDDHCPMFSGDWSDSLAIRPGYDQ